MMRSCLISLALALASAAPLQAEALYLGNEKFDTGNRAAMEAIVQHCTDVARETGRGGSNGEEPSDLQAESERPEQTSTRRFDDGASGVALDQLASGENESEGSGGASPDMSGISERLCQEAGIIY
ncbi:hypothetical protein ACR03S_06550 [Limimaricola variabilis]|uniref:hypothetical protein n=1 Tax=Limimaricola variabilis TaxID=1492771 RepID=UPI002AC9E227|nr:hypothetical protein [Limimaricola variabilis]WPY94964.1 hypothetical protein T8T21_02240 [Limimaricola variabilis]